MVAIVHHCFRSELRLAATPTPEARSTATQVSGASWCSQRTVSALTWIGGHRKLEIAAARADDHELKLSYQSGDVYHALALDAGLTDDRDRIRWKKNSPDIRDRMKALQLGLNYGMGVPSLARGLNRHPLIASGLLEMHKRKYHRFWEWRDDEVMAAMLNRRIRVFIVGRWLSPTAPTNERCIISRCNPAARKCCGWQRAGSSMQASFR